MSAVVHGTTRSQPVPVHNLRRCGLAQVSAVYRSAHWPDLGPGPLLGNPPLAGGGTLSVQLSGPVIALPAIMFQPAVPVTRTGPVTVLGVQPRAGLPRVTDDPPVSVTGPVIVESQTATSAAPSAVTGPVIREPSACSPAPASTVTGPVTRASSRHVVPDVTISGPAWRPLTVSSHSTAT